MHAMLAPWLRATWSVEQVQRFFEDEYRATLEANDVDGDVTTPQSPEPQLGGNGFTKATELREPMAFARREGAECGA